MARIEQQSNNRAEEVRRRKAQRSQQRVQAASSRVVNPINPRPVIVRGGGYGTPIHRQAGQKTARRQYYVTMDQASGTELRLPAIPLINPGWRLLSGALAILMGMIVYSLLYSPFFQVESVQVEGLQRLNGGDLSASLGLEELSILEVNPGEIHALVSRQYPELVDVQVHVDLPNVVIVSASERQPVLAWLKNDQVTWVDVDGVTFPARGEAGPLVTIHTGDDLPLAPIAVELVDQVTALNENGEANILSPLLRTVDPALLKAAQSLNQNLPEETVLIYDQQNGLGWYAPEGWQVYIGRDFNDFDARYNVYQRLTEHLIEQGLRPSLVSVAHISAPFYRLEQ
jgi:cell division septal protein FtsQ